MKPLWNITAGSHTKGDVIDKHLRSKDEDVIEVDGERGWCCMVVHRSAITVARSGARCTRAGGSASSSVKDARYAEATTIVRRR